VRCRDFVEQVTAYLDGALEAGERARIDEHLDECGDCARVLAQWREVVRLAGHLGDDDVARLSPNELMAAFRTHPPPRD